MIQRLLLGAGPESQHEEGSIRVDVVPAWADIVCDLNEKIPLIPKENPTFDYIEAHHIFEHLESTKQLKRIMRWCWEILSKDGIFDITVPHWKSDSAVECIEHVRFFNENSFMNYYQNLYWKEMGLPQFKLIKNELRDHGGHLEVHVQLSK